MLRMIVVISLVMLSTAAVAAQDQQRFYETLSGPNVHEQPPENRGHLFGGWNGKRRQLLDEGILIDFQYGSDTLGNVSGPQPRRFSNWSAVRGTVDIDLGLWRGWSGLHFHATGLWQGGNNIGRRLDLAANPSGLAGQWTFRLDSWWLEKRMRSDRLVVRAGQFAGQDAYGAQHFAVSFVFLPLGYAFANLFNTHEIFSPPSTVAAEGRAIPAQHVYVKSMVMAGLPDPYEHNPTGVVPQFHGPAVTVAEVGWTPGQDATSVRPFDDIKSRKVFSGLYQFGGAFNPSHFPEVASNGRRSGNFLLYGLVNQALWRSKTQGSDSELVRGIDATVGYDWSPASINARNRELTAGIRFNEPLPLSQHHTIAVGYVQTFFSPTSTSPDPSSEVGMEVNVLLTIKRTMVLQPVVQYFVHGGRATGALVVCGFRVRVEL